MGNENKEGTSGIGDTGYSKYDPSGAKVEKYGRNSAIHDGVKSNYSIPKDTKLREGFEK